MSRLGQGSVTLLSAIVLLLTLLAGCTQTPGSGVDAGPDAGGGPDAGRTWRSADVGGFVGGRTEISGSEITLQGSGDVAFGSDAFHFTYRTLSGDGALQVHLAEHTGGTLDGNYWPKAGIMVRAGLESGASNALLYAVENGSFQGVVLQERRTSGGETLVVGSGAGVTAPEWLRFERQGTSVRAFTASDGENWRLIGTATVSLGHDALIGLAVASGDLDGAVTLEAVFDSVSIEGVGVTPPEHVPGRPEPNPGPRTSTTYTVDATTNFLNPERGMHQEVNLLARTGFASVRPSGSTLARNYIRLDAYRHGPLPTSLLNDLAAGLAEARNHGIKIILRFSYNFGWDADAQLGTVLTHIEQLAPVLNEYQDVISVLQAGFVGAWGEWHSSTNGLLELGNKRTIGNALLRAVPVSRMIQIRTPGHIRDVVGSPDPMLDRFSAEPQARVGFKNDCLVSSTNDAGTYLGDQRQDRSEAATLSAYTVMGGETCEVAYPNPRNSCEIALRELEDFHWDYLNANWYTPVLDRWRSEGCYDRIALMLGYRLSLSDGSVTAEIVPGETIAVGLAMANTGFGKVYNPRPIEIVLRNVATGLERKLRVAADGRIDLPLAGETRALQLSATVPADLPSGDYRVYLNLPDAAPALASDARYSIRLANVGTWEDSTGYNDLQLTTTLVR